MRTTETILFFSTTKPLPEARARSRHCRWNSPISTPNGISDNARPRRADLSKRRVRGSTQRGSLKALAVIIQIRNSSSCSAEVAERCRKNSSRSQQRLRCRLGEVTRNRTRSRKREQSYEECVSLNAFLFTKVKCARTRMDGGVAGESIPRY